jgi:hypothetical protein
MEHPGNPTIEHQGEVPTLFPILLSVVIILDARAQDVERLLSGVISNIQTHVTDFEIIVVDNSPAARLRRAPNQQLTALQGLPNLQIYELMEEVDYDTAAWAGVENSLGDYVFVFDPLNDDTSRLRDALAETTRGRDIVLLINRGKSQLSAVRELQKKIFLRLFHWLGGVNLGVEAASCRLMSKRVVGYLLQFPRPAVRYRALPAFAGFSKALLYFSAPRLVLNKPSFASELRRAWRLLITNSMAPLRIASLLGFSGAALNVLYSIYVLFILLSKPDVAKGWTTLSLQSSGMFFLLSLVLFVLTEYLIHTLQVSNQGPPYFIVRESTSAVMTRRQRLNVESFSPIPSGPVA